MNKYKKKDNELAIVHTANRLMLDDISSTIKNTQQEFTELFEEVDKLCVDDTSVQELGLFLDQINEPSIDNKSADIVINHNLGSDESSLCSDWDSIIQSSRREVEKYGFDSNQTFLCDLLSPEENIAIQRQLNRPIYDRIPWDKWDYGFAFGTGIAAGILDIYVGTPGSGLQKLMVDKEHWIGRHMEKIHSLHPGYAPIDYQGAHFGGAYHRGLTTGHDLFQPLEGIRQFMDGEFRGYYWVAGKKYFIESSVNQYGNPYQPMDFGAAVLAWMIHMFCDFFSSTSLPIPGTSIAYGMDYRDLRVFVEEDLYKSGFNLRHLVLQTIPPTAIEVILRSYIFLRYHKQTVNPDALSQKKTEILAVAHSVCSAFNIGKVIILQDPLFINLPQLVALSRTMIRLVIQEYNRNSFYNKVQRNLNDLRQVQQQYEYLVEKGLSEPVVL